MDAKPSAARPRLLRQWDVLRMLPFSGSTLWRLAADWRAVRGWLKANAGRGSRTRQF